MDVLLFQTNDDGEITVEGGVVEMTSTFDTMVYLALFGGNEDDSGSPDDPLQYWGNFGEVDPVKKYVSRTQYLLRSLPATSSNRLKLQDAAKADLNCFLSAGIASSVEVTVSIPALNWVLIEVNIEADGKEFNFSFTENWRAFLQ